MFLIEDHRRMIAVRITVAILMILAPLRLCGQELYSGKTKLASGSPFPSSPYIYYRLGESVPTIQSGAVAVTVEKFYVPDYPRAQVPTRVLRLFRKNNGLATVEYDSAIPRNAYRGYHGQRKLNSKLRNKFHFAYNRNVRTDEPPTAIRPYYLFSEPDSALSDRTAMLFHYQKTFGKNTDIEVWVPVVAQHKKLIIRVIDFRSGAADPLVNQWEFHR